MAGNSKLALWLIQIYKGIVHCQSTSTICIVESNSFSIMDIADAIDDAVTSKEDIISYHEKTMISFVCYRIPSHMTIKWIRHCFLLVCWKCYNNYFCVDCTSALVLQTRSSKWRSWLTRLLQYPLCSCIIAIPIAYTCTSLFLFPDLCQMIQERFGNKTMPAL